MTLENTPDFYKSDEHKKLVNGLVKRKDTYEEILKTKFDRAIKNWSNFVGEVAIKDPRDPEKQRWRSFVNVAKAWANTLAVEATITNIITSSSPIVQVTKTKDLKMDDAQYGERLCDYAMRGNRIRSRIIPPLIRNTEIQSTQMLKLTWQDRSRVLSVSPRPEEFENFWESVTNAAKSVGGFPNPQVEPEAFKVWLDVQRTAGNTIPDFPIIGEQKIRGYVGPWYTLPSYWNVFYNPFMDDLQSQEVLFERIVVPESYIDAKCNPNDPNAPFDFNAVQEARKHKVSERFNNYEQKFYKLVGLDTGKFMSHSNDPFDEIIECHMPSNPDVPFAVIMNRQCIINKSLENPMPFGDIPYVEVQRVRLNNAGIGLTPYTANETLLYELTAMRSARLDAATLAANPAYTVLSTGMVLPKNIEPGVMYPVPSHDAIRPIQNHIVPELFKESSETAASIDEGWGVGPNVRGQQTTLNRVSAAEHQSRLTQATLPLVEFAREIEDALNITIPWIFHLFRKHATEDMKFKLLGSTLSSIDAAKLTEVLNMDYGFTGATQTANRGELSQLMLMFVKQFGVVFQPDEMRRFAKVIATTMGIPGIDEILPDPNPMLQTSPLGIGGAMGIPGPVPPGAPPVLPPGQTGSQGAIPGGPAGPVPPPPPPGPPQR